MPDLYKIKIKKNDTYKWVGYINRGGVEGYWYTNEHSALKLTEEQLKEEALLSFLSGKEYEITLSTGKPINHQLLMNVLKRYEL